VVARISHDCLYLDVLALEEGEIAAVAEGVAWAVAQLTGTAAGAGAVAAGAHPDAGMSPLTDRHS
jgi:hypothetical protein